MLIYVMMALKFAKIALMITKHSTLCPAAAAAGSIGPCATDRVRKRGGSTAGARAATAAGIRGSQRPGMRARRSLPAGFDGKSAAFAIRRRNWHRSGVWDRQSVQGDWRPCDPSLGRGHHRLARPCLRSRLGCAGFADRRDFSCAQGICLTGSKTTFPRRYSHTR